MCNAQGKLISHKSGCMLFLTKMQHSVDLKASVDVLWSLSPVCHQPMLVAPQQVPPVEPGTAEEGLVMEFVAKGVGG